MPPGSERCTQTHGHTCDGKRVHEIKSACFWLSINHQSFGILFIISRMYKLFWADEYGIPIEFFVFLLASIVCVCVLDGFSVRRRFARHLFLVGWTWTTSTLSIYIPNNKPENEPENVLFHSAHSKASMSDRLAA